MVDKGFLKAELTKMAARKKIFRAVLCVETGDGSFSWTGAAGGMQEDSRYFIASVTKLYMTAVLLRLAGEGRIRPEDRIGDYLPASLCEGLHVLKGTDHSGEITVTHLMSNTSGLPDYFFHKQAGGRTAADELMEGRDEPWPLERTIKLVKNLRPRFRPGAKGRAAYSDTNYQLLGRIIETVTGKPVGEVFREYLFEELGLKDTYAYSDPRDDSPVPYHYRDRQVWLPRYMTSVTPEGGIVSTAAEVMVFLKAFFNGRFFPKEKIGELKKWNLLLPPPGMFYFGVGLEKLFTPRILNPFKPIREVLGFWGQTGSFAFHHPETDLYFCGTTNQIDGTGHRAAGSAMIRIIKSVL
jgi:CubicO group peptidase (beta-lactamase class C family)